MPKYAAHTQGCSEDVRSDPDMSAGSSEKD